MVYVAGPRIVVMYGWRLRPSEEEAMEAWESAYDADIARVWGGKKGIVKEVDCAG